MTMYEMIQAELTAADLQMGDVTKPGAFYTLSNGRRIWTQPREVDDPIEDLFNAGQNAVTMTTVCPECYGQTHAVYTHVGDVRQSYRKCSTNAAHARVRVA